MRLKLTRKIGGNCESVKTLQTPLYTLLETIINKSQCIGHLNP